MEKRGLDQERYDVNKNQGTQDPRAQYIVLRVDPYGRDPEYIQACRDVIAKNLAPLIRGHHPELASDLEAMIDLLNEQPYTYPQGARPEDLPTPGDVYLKQGQGLQEITAVTIDPNTNEFLIHYRPAKGPKNAFPFTANFADLLAEEVADGERVRTWRKADPETGEVIAEPLPQTVEAEAAPEEHVEDEAAPPSAGEYDNGEQSESYDQEYNTY